jgi:uncharacterized protein (TIGR04255 family)
MALKFVEHDDVVFRRAPLLSVLCQIKFDPVLSLLSDVGVAGFQESIRHLYPRLHVEQLERLEVSGSPAIPQRRFGLSQSAPIWRHIDEELRWRVSVAADFIAIETPSYRDFEEFSDRLMFVLNAIERTVHPGDSTRIGLRKINVLSHPEISTAADWRRFLRPELIGIIGTEHPGQLMLGLSDVRFGEGLSELVVRHGGVPDDFVEQLRRSLVVSPVDAVPAASEADATRSHIREPAHDYLLDLDYSTIAPYPVRDGDDLAEVLQEFSDGITSFFHWAVLPPYREWLEPEPRHG